MLTRAQAGDDVAFACIFRDVQPGLLRCRAVSPAPAVRAATALHLPLTAALVAAAAGLGSAAAAYAGVLPGPIQDLAHASQAHGSGVGPLPSKHSYCQHGISPAAIAAVGARQPGP
jgi:hypothetical protein